MESKPCSISLICRMPFRKTGFHFCAACSRVLAAIIALFFLAAAGARAERLTTSLSSSRVLIAPNYTGADLVLFGAIEPDAATVSRAGGYDIVITATGPRGPLTVRQRMQAGPIWINRDQRRFLDIPSYLSVLSSRPLAEVTGPELAERFKLGVENIVHAPDALTANIDRQAIDYRDALIRLKRSRGLFFEEPRGVTFLNQRLFRATIRLPAFAPVGSYDVSVRLFSGSALLAETANSIEVSKAGAEALMANAARNRPWLYGLALCLIVLFSGFVAHLMFRKN